MERAFGPERVKLTALGATSSMLFGFLFGGREIQGSLHCATNGGAVCRSGRDDVIYCDVKAIRKTVAITFIRPLPPAYFRRHPFQDRLGFRL